MSYDVFADYYDVLTSNIDYKKRANYFNELIKKHKKTYNQTDILLDLGCGTGSLSLEFQKLGYDVIGVDKSYDMLSRAMEKNDKNKILFLNQDILNLDLYGTIDIVVSALDTINHLCNLEDVLKAFLKVSLFLHLDGLFILDLNSQYKHQNILANNVFVYDYGFLYTIWRNNLNKDKSIDIDLDFFSKTNDKFYKKDSEHFKEIYISCEDIKEICRKSGLEILKVYGDDTFLKPKEKTERLIYVLKKAR
ncbi:MAG: class I SAM-dependent DNA methyltransferase [Oscillospiraceae bacterium]